MGFFCFKCNKKVRGQPMNHGCTRQGGKRLQRRIYAAKFAMKEYNQLKAAGFNPPKPRCLKRQEARNRNRRSKQDDEPWNDTYFWKSEDECIVCGCSRTANCRCDLCFFGCSYTRDCDYQPWNHPYYWKSEDECIVCGCSRHAENCLCGACRFGCRYDSQVARDIIRGCSRQVDNCLCGACRFECKYDPQVERDRLV